MSNGCRQGYLPFWYNLPGRKTAQGDETAIICLAAVYLNTSHLVLLINDQAVSEAYTSNQLFVLLSRGLSAALAESDTPKTKCELIKTDTAESSSRE